jgi:predicted ribosome quality control (RQC) complex YloA/Tae2 family protein
VKLKGLFAHQGTDPELADTRLLPLGRVVYVGQRSLVVLGRDAAENEKLIQAAQKGDLLVRLAELAGPQALVRVHAPDTAESLLAEAKKLVTQYSRAARETAGELAWEVVEG